MNTKQNDAPRPMLFSLHSVSFPLPSTNFDPSPVFLTLPLRVPHLRHHPLRKVHPALRPRAYPTTATNLLLRAKPPLTTPDIGDVVKLSRNGGWWASPGSRGLLVG